MTWPEFILKWIEINGGGGNRMNEKLDNLLWL